MYRGGEKMARVFNPDDTGMWGENSREAIEKCLNCDRERCNNCLEGNKRFKKRVYRGGYVQIQQSTGAIVAIYNTAYEAAEKVGLSPTSIYKYVNMGVPVSGFIWKRKGEVEGLT